MISRLRSAGRDSYIPMMDDEMLEKELMFVDFLPEQMSSDGAFHETKYESFISLMDRANHWLRANSQWKIKTLESVVFIKKGNEINSRSMIFNKRLTKYVRGLRLWIRKCNSKDEKIQQIGYINMVPKKKLDRNLLSSVVFETLDEIIGRFNVMVKTNPIPGRIINIESIKIKLKHSKDPDKSSWTEKLNIVQFLYMIRIYYEVTDGPHIQSEEIGIKNFIPKLLKEGGILPLSLPVYENFSTVVQKASDWSSQQKDVKICNLQSLEIKVKKDTNKMKFSETIQTKYIRILRLAYVKAAVDSETDINITSRAFSPVQRSLTLPEYETKKETLERICEWVKLSGADAHIVNFETTYMRLKGPGELKNGLETTYSFTVNNTVNNSNYSSIDHWLYVIRIYINGPYREPPVELLPPVPMIHKESCSMQ